MKRRALHLLSLAIFLLLSSCAGYHFNTSNNPLIGYDIKSVAVPMFINRTNIAGLSPMMTKEIILTLNEYSGLRVYGGDFEYEDKLVQSKLIQHLLMFEKMDINFLKKEIRLISKISSNANA
jgi:hypothetical protein